MVGGTKLPPQDSQSEPGCYERKTRATARTKAKTLHEGKRQKPSQVYVSLDNADTVIDGGRARHRVDSVIVRRQLIYSQSRVLGTTGLAKSIILQSRPLPSSYRNASAQIGQRKGSYAITSICVADQIKERCVLCDLQ